MTITTRIDAAVTAMLRKGRAGIDYWPADVDRYPSCHEVMTLYGPVRFKNVDYKKTSPRMLIDFANSFNKKRHANH